MRVIPFVQGTSARHTLERLEALFREVQPDEVLFCFAYATLSGCATFERTFGQDFWARNQTRWLLGIDYGRTPPDALTFLAARRNVSIRIMNGGNVVERQGFIPEQDFHMKACFASRARRERYGVVIGSGNFSRRGLVSSHECGVMLTASDRREYRVLQPSFEQVTALWDDADPVDDILERYRRRWTRSIFVPPDEENEDDGPAPPEDFSDIDPSSYRYFWIDAGYVTRNRGADAPGNQFDLPRGVHRFFGLRAARNQRPNSVIGDINFVLGRERLTRALRLGNNLMEKITLPIPERYGFGAYDGTILEFERVRGGFALTVTDSTDYLRLHGRDSDLVRFAMGSGRPFGVRGRN